MASPISPYEDLLNKIQTNISSTGGAAVACQQAFGLSRAWIEKYSVEFALNPAHRLLNASRSASIEAVSAISLGLARPAVFLLRSHYELFLMFLFYKNHPVELRAAENDVEFMKLPGEISKYLKKYYPEFEKRWKLLEVKKQRPKREGYSRLSEIVHGSSATAAPVAAVPTDVCFLASEIAPIISLVSDICEEISDVALATHEGNWLTLPLIVQQNLAARHLDSEFKSI